LVITDRRQAAPRSLEWVLTAAFEGGARWASVREKDLTPDDRFELLRRLQPLAASYAAILMVHDDLDAARRLRLDGLHLPSDGNVEIARRNLPHALIGQSWHGTEPIGRSGRSADYLTLSPIYLSASKPGYGPALGLAGLAELRARTDVRLIALGGIEETTIAACKHAGGDGVAVMGAIMRAADPARVTADLLSRLSSADVQSR